MKREVEPSGSKQSPEALLKLFISGGVAGCCAKTTVAPLDRVKLLLQAHNQHYKHLGVLATHRHVVKKEGFLGLYKGNGVQMIRIFPYAAIQYLSFEQYKRVFKSIFPDHNHLNKLASGSIAGLTAVLFTYPLDVIRTRLAFQVKGEHVYIGMLDAARTMVSMEGGTRALYRGMTPTIIGMAPYAGLSFYGFETLKNLCLEYFPSVFGKPCPQNTGGLVLIIPAKLLCGGIAGAFAQTISYPIDVVRRRQQLYKMLPESHKYDGGMWRTLYVIYRDDGISKGLFRGLTINYVRVIPMVSVSFCVYETMKQLLGLDTGVDR